MKLCNYLFNISLLGGLRVKDLEFPIDRIGIESIKKIEDGKRVLRATAIYLVESYQFKISAIVFGSLSNINVDHLRFQSRFYHLPLIMMISFLGYEDDSWFYASW